MKKRYVRFIEKVRKGHAYKYDGMIVDDAKEEFTAIVQGPDNDDRISKRTFSKEEWIVEDRSESEVKHSFDLSLLNSSRQLINAEFEVEEKKLEKNRNESRYKEVFG